MHFMVRANTAAAASSIRSNKTRFYYHGMEFSLDWTRGTSQLVNVFYRPEPTDSQFGEGLPGGMPDCRSTSTAGNISPTATTAIRPMAPASSRFGNMRGGRGGARRRRLDGPTIGSA